MSVQAAMNNLAMSGLGFTRGFTNNVLGLDILKKEEKKPDDNKTSDTKVEATEETTTTTDTPTAIETEGIKKELEELDERETTIFQEQTKKIETQNNQREALKERADYLKSLSTKEMVQEMVSRGQMSPEASKRYIKREKKGETK